MIGKGLTPSRRLGWAAVSRECLGGNAEVRLGDLHFDWLSDVGELESDSPKAPPADA